MTRLPRPCLMLVTEPSPRLPEIVAQAVAGGVDVVQWRDKDAAPGVLFERAWAVSEATGHRALLVINGWPNLVRKVDADGVHLPGGSPFSVPGVRTLAAGGLISRPVHSVAEAQAAAEEGADYVVAGTIFASGSHPDIAPAGLDFLRDVCAAVSIPVLAIGGVTPENTADCIRAGAAGVAVLSPIMRAADPEAMARKYRAALDAAWEKRTHPAARGGAPPETGG